MSTIRDVGKFVKFLRVLAKEERRMDHQAVNIQKILKEDVPPGAIVIMVSGGCADSLFIPEGVKVEIWDYDNGEVTDFDNKDLYKDPNAALFVRDRLVGEGRWHAFPSWRGEEDQ